MQPHGYKLNKISPTLCIVFKFNLNLLSVNPPPLRWVVPVVPNHAGDHGADWLPIIYCREIYFQGYKISRIGKNLLMAEYFVEGWADGKQSHYSRLVDHTISRINLFKVLEISMKSWSFKTMVFSMVIIYKISICSATAPPMLIYIDRSYCQNENV